jgi:hypothetical protein
VDGSDENLCGPRNDPNRAQACDSQICKVKFLPRVIFFTLPLAHVTEINYSLLGLLPTYTVLFDYPYYFVPKIPFLPPPHTDINELFPI